MPEKLQAITRKRAFPRTQPCWRLDPGCPSIYNCDKWFLTARSPSSFLSQASPALVCGQLRQPQLIITLHFLHLQLCVFPGGLLLLSRTRYKYGDSGVRPPNRLVLRENGSLLPPWGRVSPPPPGLQKVPHPQNVSHIHCCYSLALTPFTTCSPC